ncbi:MAG: hypothetical protein JWR10_4747, partial [Rubritepida sp.]|nr:hypothetical protein [Rubritepida sp.]
MDGLYFLVMLMGIAWLAVWAARDKPPADKGWWLFDMREDAPDVAGTGAAADART